VQARRRKKIQNGGAGENQKGRKKDFPKKTFIHNLITTHTAVDENHTPRKRIIQLKKANERTNRPSTKSILTQPPPYKKTIPGCNWLPGEKIKTKEWTTENRKRCENQGGKPRRTKLAKVLKK